MEFDFTLTKFDALLVCNNCKKPFTKPVRYVRKSLKKGQGYFFCSKRCGFDSKILTDKELRDKFIVETIKTDKGCWVWSTDSSEYGVASVKGKLVRAHRLSYMLFVGEIPKNIVVRHKCDTPLCVNPEHLELGTVLDNVKDRVSRKRGARGESMGAAKLTEAQVIEARRLYSLNTPGKRPPLHSYKSLAKQFGVCMATMGSLLKGENWSYLIPTTEIGSE